MKKKIVLGLTALILVVGLTIGGTLAFMQSKTAQVVNTFTVGSVHLSLAETYEQNSQLIPGTVIAKTPVLTVAAGSEAAYVRAKVEVSPALQALITNYSDQHSVKNVDTDKITIDFNTTDWDWSSFDTTGFVYYRGTPVSPATVGTTGIVAKNAAATVLPALFTKIDINGKTVTNEDLAHIVNATDGQIKVTGYAIQAATFDDATAAWAAFNNSNTNA